jgi:hypothetical protein
MSDTDRKYLFKYKARKYMEKLKRINRASQSHGGSNDNLSLTELRNELRTLETKILNGGGVFDEIKNKLEKLIETSKGKKVVKEIVPEEEVHEEKVSEEKVPDEAVHEEKVPDEAVHEEKVPEEEVRGEVSEEVSE